jgi:hypothetical protein
MLIKRTFYIVIQHNNRIVLASLVALNEIFFVLIFI